MNEVELRLVSDNTELSCLVQCLVNDGKLISVVANSTGYYPASTNLDYYRDAPRYEIIVRGSYEGLRPILLYLEEQRFYDDGV